ncbi:MAG: RND transporter, partial [Luteitalea sp.]|nr:RND transporter [Luteitalea sp.]
MVDIARPPEVIRRRKMRRAAYGVVALTAILLITVGVSRLKPAAPPVERGTIWPYTVQRGAMIRNVRGTGRLVPLDINWVAAPAAGRIDRVLLRPGVRVEENTVVVEMSNPVLTQEVTGAELELKGAEARLAKARADLTSALLTLEAIVADVSARYEHAKAQADGYTRLHKDNLVSDNELLQYTSTAKGLGAQLEAERKRLKITEQTAPDQLAEQQSEVNRLRTVYVLKREQLDDLRVRAGVPGVLTA